MTRRRSGRAWRGRRASSRFRAPAAFALAVSWVALTLACGGAGEPSESAGTIDASAPVIALPPGFTQAQLDDGREAYHGVGLCFSCHAPNGRGGFLGPDLTDAEWFHIDGSVVQIAGIIAGGVATPVGYPEPMPAMGGSELSDTAIQNLALYVWTLSQGDKGSGSQGDKGPGGAGS